MMAEDGSKLIYTFNARQNEHDISDLIEGLNAKGIRPKHIESRESSLEDIFIRLVGV
jgi:ABC-2 type transport system ATP-binding protein